MRKLLITGLAAVMTMNMGITSLAAGWQQNETGWWYDNGDGTWPSNTWQWIDGNQDGTAECYYFDIDGYMLANTVVDGQYTVNAEGAWTVDGIVQTQAVVQNVAGAASENKAAQDAFAAGADMSGIDRSIGNGFIRQQYVDVLGRNEAYVRQVFGEPLSIHNTEGRVSFVYAGDLEVYFQKGVVSSIFDSVGKMTAWDGVSDITYKELTELLNAQTPKGLEGVMVRWKLQENPSVTFTLIFPSLSTKGYVGSLGIG